MKFIFPLLMLCGLALGQNAAPPSSEAKPPEGDTAAADQNASTTPNTAAPVAARKELLIPAGTKVPLVLKQAISTKNAKEGDAVYCETTFPIVQDGKVVIPAGTYVQGKISHVQRGGHIHGRAEVLLHFTTLVYPNGYTVALPGSVENVPGSDKSSVKDEEGAVRADSQTGEKAATIAQSGATGALIGGIARGGKGALVGGLGGAAVGTVIGMFGRGNDVKLENGSSVEMVINRQVTVDASRVVARQMLMQ